MEDEGDATGPPFSAADLPPPPVPPPPPAPPPPPVLYRFGPTSVTATQVTCAGVTHPLAGTTWTVTQHTITKQRTSWVGWLLAAIFVWACLLGLLFLLIRQNYLDGYVVVSIEGPGFSHSEQIKVTDVKQVALIEQQVQAIRGMALAAGS